MLAITLLLSCTSKPPAVGSDSGDGTALSDGEADGEAEGGDSGTEGRDSGAAPAGCPEGTVHPLETSGGCLSGVATEGGEGWFGVPYAEAPVGALRWARPVPAAPWEGALAAEEVGPPCVQAADSAFGDLRAGDGEEDCLSLNIMRPEGASDLPILFFIHGGGHSSGSGGSATFVDNPLLTEGAVVVTHNYRLGPLGFLAHPALSAEAGDDASGNQGLWDSLLALQWVRDNAEALGGDPEKILLFGESAGAVSACALMAAPAAAGLFSSVLLESGTCLGIDGALRGEEEGGEALGEALAEALGCEGDEALACMRAASPEAVMAALPIAGSLLDSGYDFGPIVDGALLDRPPAERIADGDFSPAPLIVGANADEATLFTLGLPIETEDQLESWLRGVGLLLGIRDRDQLVALYTAGDYGSPKGAFDAFFTDAVFACPARWLQAAVAPYAESRGYWFTHVSRFYEELGAFHGAELVFVFGTLDAWYTEGEVQLSEAMRGAWTSAAEGAPSVPGLGDWPLGDTWIDWSEAPSTVEAVRAETCSFLEESGLNPLAP